ncbi:MAG: hypothetical protein ACR652_07640 [Methylocystis sp.]|uniref:hypothetical protein n=1 Tax=Methylocystis sp. TaxID=1911079 RepID=UPI003DA292B7
MTEEQVARHPARDAALRETATRLARIAIKEADDVTLAHCTGTFEAAIGMMKARTSPRETAAFLLSAAEAIMDQEDHAQRAAGAELKAE